MNSSKNLTIIDWIFTNNPQHYGLIPGCGFPTGIFLFIVLLAMYIFSVKYVRKGGYFEVLTLNSLSNKCTPLRTPRISGTSFFHFEILLALSELPANLPGQSSLSEQLFLHCAAATLKGLVECQNEKK